MLNNYFKIAYRYLLKQKGYAFINIIGLAVGLASCIIILLYVNHELSYDKHHNDAERIYRLRSTIDFSGNYFDMVVSPAPMGPTLQADYPEVEAMARFRDRGSYLIRTEDVSFKEQNIVFTDQQVFDVFNIPLVKGSSEDALTAPNTLVISKRAALKFFGSQDVIGESLLLDNEHTFTIMAVMEDMPSTSHFNYDFLLSMPSIDEAMQMNWFSNNFVTYIKLRPGIDAEQFLPNIYEIQQKYMEPQLQQIMGINFKEFRDAGNLYEHDLQPLLDIHLKSDFVGELQANGSITYVYIFSGLALFILLLACINFMNLATARSSQRAKEVGIRKTLGSMRKQLAIQFLSESILLSFMAFILSLLLVEITLPFFSDIAGRTIESNYMNNPYLMVYIVAIVLVTGVLAGLYPAFMLSSFRPVSVLKGSHPETWGHSFLRKGLVVFQFCISMIIVVSLLVMNKQMSFVHNKDLGFEKDKVLVLNDTYAIGDTDQVLTFKKELLRFPVIKSATTSAYFPVAGYYTNDTVYWPEGNEPSELNTVSMQTWTVDEDYIPTLGMKILQGRNYSKERSQEQDAVILNESALKKLGIEDPIGKIIHTYGQDSPDAEHIRDIEIIGIVENFHYESLRENIKPLGLFYSNNRNNIAVKISTTDMSETINSIKELWNQYAPNQPFTYSFLNERFDAMYRAELRVQNLMASFSILAIVIACLGLFGLSAYSAERRNKEIGIRKVLGANVQSILKLVSKEFLQLISISFIISIPIAWFVMDQWLEGFTYHTTVDIQTFAIAGFGILLITLFTVSGQSIKAALTNPIDSLRSE